MKTLLDAEVRTSLDRRLARLRPDSVGRWGRMTAPQMVCHLTDAFRGVMGERGAPAVVSAHPARQAVMKWVALSLPGRWPHGLRTRPAADQEKQGTPPTEFTADLRKLELAIRRFVDRLPEVSRQPHFVFGVLTPAEWARWGYLHVDHHLRQFGL